MDKKAKKEELEKALEQHKQQVLLITGYLACLAEEEAEAEPNRAERRRLKATK